MIYVLDRGHGLHVDLLSAMPACGGHDLLEALLEDPKDMKTVTYLPGVLINERQAHWLVRQDV